MKSVFLLRVNTQVTVIIIIKLQTGVDAAESLRNKLMKTLVVDLNILIFKCSLVGLLSVTVAHLDHF